MTDQLTIFKKYIENEIGSLIPSWKELAEIVCLREFRIYPATGVVSVFMMNTTQTFSHLRLLKKMDRYFLVHN